MSTRDIWGRRARDPDGTLHSALTVPGGEAGPSRKAALGALALLLLLMAVLPTWGFFSFHRAQLAGAAGIYLADAGRDAAVARCDAARASAQRYKAPYDAPAEIVDGERRWRGTHERGWTLAESEQPAPTSGASATPCSAFVGAQERMAELEQRFPSTPGMKPGLLATVYGPVTAFSGLARDLFARLVAEEGDSRFQFSQHRSPRLMLDALLGSDTGKDTSGGNHYLDMVAAAFPFALLGLLLCGLSLTSLVSRILGIGVRLERLAEAPLRRLPSSWALPSTAPLRACVVHRSDRRARLLQEQLLERRFGAIRRAVRTAEGVAFLPERRAVARGAVELEGSALAAAIERRAEAVEPRPVLHVVDTLELFMFDTDARQMLLLALEDLVDRRASVLLCSRMIPGFWLSRMAEGVTGDVLVTQGLAAETTRWAHVFGPLDTRRLIVAPYDEIRELFLAELAEIPVDVQNDPRFRAVAQVMLDEAFANPELLELAGAVTRQCVGTLSGRAGAPEQAALRRFVAGAASYFHELWSASTREERLQLYALAKGGYVDSAQVGVLSSLANRSLINAEGVIRMRSRAFASFIDHDLVHDHLLAWRDEGHGNVWKSIWPPIALLIVLAVAFFVSSTPEALGPLAALFAAGLGAVPLLGGLLRSFRDLKPTAGS